MSFNNTINNNSKRHCELQNSQSSLSQASVPELEILQCALEILSKPLIELRDLYANDSLFRRKVEILGRKDTLFGQNHALAQKIQEVVSPNLYAPSPPSLKEQLFHACGQNNLAEINPLLVQLQHPYGLINEKGQTPLHASLATGTFNLEVIQSLVSYCPGWLQAADLEGRYPIDCLEDTDHAISMARVFFSDDPLSCLAFLCLAKNPQHVDTYLRALPDSTWTFPITDDTWDKLKLILSICQQRGKTAQCKALLLHFVQMNRSLPTLTLAAEVNVELASSLLFESFEGANVCSWPKSYPQQPLTTWKYRPAATIASVCSGWYDDVRLLLCSHPELVICFGPYEPFARAFFLEEEVKLQVPETINLCDAPWLVPFFQSPTFPANRLSLEVSSIPFIFSILTLFGEAQAEQIINAAVEKLDPDVPFYPFDPLLGQEAVYNTRDDHYVKIYKLVMAHPKLQLWNRQSFQFCFFTNLSVKPYCWVVANHPIFRHDPSYLGQLLNAFAQDKSPKLTEVDEVHIAALFPFLIKTPDVAQLVQFLAEKSSDAFTQSIIQSIVECRDISDTRKIDLLENLPMRALLIYVENPSAYLDPVLWKKFAENFLSCSSHHDMYRRFYLSLKGKVDLNGISNAGIIQQFLRSHHPSQEMIRLLFELGDGLYPTDRAFRRNSHAGHALSFLSDVYNALRQHVQSNKNNLKYRWECRKLSGGLYMTIKVQKADETHTVFTGYATADAVIRLIHACETSEETLNWHAAATWLRKHISMQHGLIKLTLDEAEKAVTIIKSSLTGKPPETTTLVFGRDFHDLATLRNAINFKRYYDEEAERIGSLFPGIPIYTPDESVPSLDRGEHCIQIGMPCTFNARTVTGMMMQPARNLNELSTAVFSYYLEKKYKAPSFVQHLDSVADVCNGMKSILNMRDGLAYYAYPTPIFAGHFCMYKDPSGFLAADFILRSPDKHARLKELAEIAQNINPHTLNVSACNALAAQDNEASSAARQLPPSKADVDLRLLLSYLEVFAQDAKFLESLAKKGVTHDSAKNNLDFFINCLLEKKGIRDLNPPAKYHDTYVTLEIYFSHTLKKLRELDDLNSLRCLVFDMCTCERPMCSNERLQIAAQHYNLAFGILDAALANDLGSCQTVQDMIGLAYRQAFLATKGIIINMVFDNAARDQSTHLNACITHLIEKELRLKAPYDISVSNIQNDVKKDNYIDTGREEFPDGTIAFLFPPLFTMQLVRTLHQFQNDLVKANNWGLLGQLRQSVQAVVEDILKRPGDGPKKEAKEAYKGQVAAIDKRVAPLRQRVEELKAQLLVLSQHPDVVVYMENAASMVNLKDRLQLLAEESLQLGRRITELEKKEKEPKLPRVPLRVGTKRPHDDSEGSGLSELIAETRLHKEQVDAEIVLFGQQIEAMEKLTVPVYASLSRVQQYEEGQKALKQAESLLETAAAERGNIGNIVDTAAIDLGLLDDKKEIPLLTLQAWIPILRLYGVLKMQATALPKPPWPAKA